MTVNDFSRIRQRVLQLYTVWVVVLTLGTPRDIKSLVSSLSLEAENLAVLSSQPIDGLRLRLIHLQQAFTLSVLVCGGTGNERRGLTVEFFPYFLRFQKGEKNRKKMADVGVARRFGHAGVVGRRDHRIETFGVDDGRAVSLRLGDETIGEGRDQPEFPRLEAGYKDSPACRESALALRAL